MVRCTTARLVLFFLTLSTASCTMAVTTGYDFPPLELTLAQGQSPRDAIVEVIKRVDKCLEPRKVKWNVSPDYENLMLNVAVAIPDVEGSGRDRVMEITVEFLLDSVPSPQTTKITVIPKVKQDSAIYLRDYKVRVNDHDRSSAEIRSLKEEVKSCLYPKSPA